MNPEPGNGYLGGGAGRARFTRTAAYLAVGALSIVALVLLLLLRPAAGQAYLLPGLLLILVLAAVVPKIWERPALGIAGAVLLVAVPWGSGEGAGTNITPPDLAIVAVAALIGARVLLKGDQGRLRSWVILPLAGVVVAGGIATMAAENPATSLVGLVRFAELFAVVPVATYLALQSRRDLWLILGSVVLLGVFEGALGVYQYFTSTGAQYGEAGNRAVGTFGAYGILGMAQVVTYAIIVSTAAFAALRGGRRYGFLFLTVALCLPLAFSFSRGFWIAAVVAVVAMLALTSRKMLVVFVLAGILVLAAETTFSEDSSNSLAYRLTSIYSATSSPDQSVQDRYAMWQAARSMWTDHPFTGIGIKNFPYFRDYYAPLSFSGGSDIADPEAGSRRVELLSPHSLYWLILAEQGIAGGLAYSVLFASLGIAGLRRLSRLKAGTVEHVFGLACIGFLASYVVSSIYGDLGGSPEILNSVFLGGLAWLASGTELDKES